MSKNTKACTADAERACSNTGSSVGFPEPIGLRSLPCLTPNGSTGQELELELARMNTELSDSAKYYSKPSSNDIVTAHDVVLLFP